jgi:hypothetical protein
MIRTIAEHENYSWTSVLIPTASISDAVPFDTYGNLKAWATLDAGVLACEAPGVVGTTG